MNATLEVSEWGRDARASGIPTFVPLFQGNRSLDKASPRFWRQGSEGMRTPS